jgi:hypothetical protein
VLRCGQTLAANSQRYCDDFISSTTSRRVITASVALGPLEPLSLASAGLKVRRNGRDVLTAGDHGAAHFVAVGIDCEGVSKLYI